MPPEKQEKMGGKREGRGERGRGEEERKHREVRVLEDSELRLHMQSRAVVHKDAAPAR